MGAGRDWQPIETAPRDGTLVLLWCAFGDADEPAIARWTNESLYEGPFGKFSWRELDGGGIAELIPTHWKRIGKPRRPAPTAPQGVPDTTHNEEGLAALAERRGEEPERTSAAVETDVRTHRGTGL